MKIVVVSDSNSDEYRQENNRGSSGDKSDTFNWIELGVNQRSIDFGALANWADYRRNGYEYNNSRSGKETSWAVGSPLTNAKSQVSTNNIEHAVVWIGTNDFSPKEPSTGSGSNYNQIYSGALTGSALTTWEQNITDRHTTIFQELKLSGVLYIVSMDINDWSQDTSIWGAYPNATKRQRVTDSTNRVNSLLASVCTTENVGYISIATFFNEILGTRGLSSFTYDYGGKTMDAFNTGDGLFVALNDGHFGTILHAQIFNRFILQYRITYGNVIDISFFADQEALSIEGVQDANAPRISNVSATYETGNITVLFDTDISADTQIFTSSDLLSQSSSYNNASLVTTHSATFAMTEGTFYKIKSENSNGYDIVEFNLAFAPVSAGSETWSVPIITESETVNVFTTDISTNTWDVVSMTDPPLIPEQEILLGTLSTLISLVIEDSQVFPNNLDIQATSFLNMVEDQRQENISFSLLIAIIQANFGQTVDEPSHYSFNTQLEDIDFANQQLENSGSFLPASFVLDTINVITANLFSASLIYNDINYLLDNVGILSGILNQTVVVEESNLDLQILSILVNTETEEEYVGLPHFSTSLITTISVPLISDALIINPASLLLDNLTVGLPILDQGDAILDLQLTLNNISTSLQGINNPEIVGSFVLGVDGVLMLNTTTTVLEEFVKNPQMELDLIAHAISQIDEEDSVLGADIDLLEIQHTINKLSVGEFVEMFYLDDGNTDFVLDPKRLVHLGKSRVVNYLGAKKRIVKINVKDVTVLYRLN